MPALKKDIIIFNNLNRIYSQAFSNLANFPLGFYPFLGLLRPRFPSNNNAEGFIFWFLRGRPGPRR
jgi:hypothetical protein